MLRVHGKNSQILRNDVIKTKLLPVQDSGPLRFGVSQPAVSPSSSASRISLLCPVTYFFKDTTYFIFDPDLPAEFGWNWLLELKASREDGQGHRHIASPLAFHSTCSPYASRLSDHHQNTWVWLCPAGLCRNFGLSPAQERDLIRYVFSCLFSLNSYQLK